MSPLPPVPIIMVSHDMSNRIFGMENTVEFNDVITHFQLVGIHTLVDYIAIHCDM